MKWNNRFYCVIKTLRTQSEKILLNCFVLILCFYITDTLITDYAYKEKAETMQMDMIRFPKERTGKLLFNAGISFNSMKELEQYQNAVLSIIQELQEMEEIEDVVSFSFESGDVGSEETIPVLQLNGNAKYLGKLELQEGIIEAFDEVNGEQVTPILVGNDFKEKVHVGDRLLLKRNAKETVQECQVVGILKENSHWFGENAFYLRGLQTLDSYIVMEKEEMVVQMSDTSVVPKQEIYFVIKEGEGIEKTIEKIQSLFFENAVVGRAEMLQDLLDGMMKNMNISLKKQMEFCFTVIGIAFLFLAVYMVIQVWERKKQFGIFLSCGMGKKDLVSILVIEEMLVAFFSWALVYGYRCWEIEKRMRRSYVFMDPQESFDWVMKMVHGRETLVIEWILLIGIGIFIWGITEYVFRRKKIMELM